MVQRLETLAVGYIQKRSSLLEVADGHATKPD